MKHTEKLNMQDSASFIIALIIMAGTYVVIMAGHSALKIPLVISYIEASIMLTFNHKQQDL